LLAPAIATRPVPGAGEAARVAAGTQAERAGEDKDVSADESEGSLTSQQERDALLAAVLHAPYDKTRLAVFADWLEENGDPHAEVLRRGRMPVDDADRMAAIVLQACNFAPATFEKRFVRNVCPGLSDDSTQELSPSQRFNLWRLVWRYRKQILAHGDMYHGAMAWQIPKANRRYLLRVAEFLTR
jgi:uncharacterized protein (TIGR02996 family)